MTSAASLATNASHKVSKLDLGAVGVLIAAMSFLLNHSMLFAGFNVSLADPLLAAVLLSLVISSRLYILRYSFLFFTVLIGVAVFTTIWVTPAIFDVQTSPRPVFGDIIKLIISFSYFIVGTSVARIGLQRIVLKWFAYGALFVASLALVMEATQVRIMSDILYFGDLRFRGFMSDPNFYSVLACAGFTYFAYSSQVHAYIRWPAMLILASSVILSGSKTGLIALIILITIILVTRALQSRRIGPAALLIVGATIFLVFLDSIRQSLADLSERFEEAIPQLERTTLLLSDDALEGISSDGSSRDAMWSVGLEIIQLSPIVGVGVGNYSAVGIDKFSQPGIAHNTFIQLAAEWGLVLAGILFAWVAYLLLHASMRNARLAKNVDILVLRDFVTVFMIGSMSLSLNNARMLWLFLGILAYMSYTKFRVNGSAHESKELLSPT